MLVELHVPDFAIAVEFYNFLGFMVVRSEPNYRVLAYENRRLMLYGGQADVGNHSFFSSFPNTTVRGYGVELVHSVANLEQLYDSLSCGTPGLGEKIVTEIKLRPWGLRDFRISDPFGFYLRITEPWDPTRPID